MKNIKVILYFCFILIGCTLFGPHRITGNDIIKQKKQPDYTVQMAFLWDGSDIEPHALRAVRSFRKDYPEIKVKHFVNPVYFIRAESTDFVSQLKSMIMEGDTVAIHIAPWKSLVEKSNVSFRNGPTFWGDALSIQHCVNDCGLDVSVNVYSVEDIRKILLTSISVFQEAGFSKPNGMVIGGWQSTDLLQKLAWEQGIREDYSAIAPDSLGGYFDHFPIGKWIKRQWTEISAFAQPVLKDVGYGVMMQVPINGGSPEYLTSDQILQRFLVNTGQNHTSQIDTMVFTIGVFPSTMFHTVGTLRRTVEQIKAAASRKAIALRFNSATDNETLAH